MARISSKTEKEANAKGFPKSIPIPTQQEIILWLWETHKIWVCVGLTSIDSSESSFIWMISRYIKEGKEGSRKKGSWDFWEDINSFTEKYMYWHEDPTECLEKGIQEALKMIEKQ